MTRKIRCRVCKREFESFGFQSHVNKHKREFAKVINRVEWEAHNINWEDVVKFYNPSEANLKKCLNYEIPKSKFKTLSNYE
jgi:hypothetical protein